MSATGCIPIRDKDGAVTGFETFLIPSECACPLCAKCSDCGYVKYHALECPQRQDEGGRS